MKSNFCFFSLSISLLLLPLIYADDEVPVKGWIPIEDVNASYIRVKAESAVRDINWQSKTNVTLDRILKGEQNLRNINGRGSADYYRLLLAVKDGAQSEWYEATVKEIPEQYVRELISFKRVK